MLGRLTVPEITVYTTSQQLFDKVCHKYARHDQELTTLHFSGVELLMPAKDFFETYRRLQEDINGDEIVCLKDAEEFDVDGKKYIRGTKIPVDKWEFPFDIMQGDAKIFLDALNQGIAETFGFYRLCNGTVAEWPDKSVAGLKLDFCW